MAFVPPQFGDLGKKCKDLFKRQYDFKNEVKVIRKAGGVKVESGGYHGKALVGYTKANFKLQDVGDVEVEVHSNAEAKGSIKRKQNGVSFNLNSNFSDKVALDGSYSQESIAVKAEVSHVFSKAQTSVCASASVGVDGVSVGGQLSVDQTGSPKDYNLAAEYSQSDLIASLVTSNKCLDTTASYYQKVSKDLVIGSSMLVKDDQSRLFTFGGDYVLDKDTTLRAKADSKGIVSTAISHTLSDPSLKFAVSAQFDAFGSDVLVAQKFGVSMSFGEF